MIIMFSVLENKQEQDSMEAFFITWSQKFYRAAYGLMKNNEDAEDMVMVAVSRVMDRYQFYSDIYTKGQESRLGGLVIRMVQRACLNEIKRRAKRGEPAISMDDPDTEALTGGAGASAPGFEDKFVQIEPLRNAMKKLKERDQNLLYAVFILRYTKAEAGTFVGLGVNGVKSRLQVLLKKLKEELMEVD